MCEDMTPNPMSPYALHKHIEEQYESLFARLFGMSVVSLRTSTCMARARRQEVPMRWCDTSLPEAEVRRQAAHGLR